MALQKRSPSSQYFDQEYPKPFFNASGQSVHEGPTLKAELEKYALGNVDVAIRLLQAIKFGRINIFCHERLLDWFQNYHYLVRQHGQKPLSDAYFAAMAAIVEKVDLWYKYRGYQNALSKKELKEYFAFGDSAVIAQILLRMRFFCTKEAFRHWATNYGRDFEPNVVERPGIVRLFVDAPQDLKYADSFEGNYIYGAKIIRIEQMDKWEIVFEDYFPNHKHFSSMWTLMFGAVIPLVEPLLMAKLYSVAEWQFTD
jgi:hypothetical protein